MCCSKRPSCTTCGSRRCINYSRCGNNANYRSSCCGRRSYNRSSCGNARSSCGSSRSSCSHTNASTPPAAFISSGNGNDTANTTNGCAHCGQAQTQPVVMMAPVMQNGAVAMMSQIDIPPPSYAVANAGHGNGNGNGEKKQGLWGKMFGRKAGAMGVDVKEKYAESQYGSDDE